MLAAELSALNLGDYVEFQTVRKGTKTKYIYSGVLTEVSHNKVDGDYTTLRVVYRNKQLLLTEREANPQRFLDNTAAAVRRRSGTAISVPYDAEIEVTTL